MANEGPAPRAFEQVFDLLPYPPKPRTTGVTEIRDRGLGMNAIEDLVSLMGEYIDVVKAANGSQRLFPREMVLKKNRYLRENQISVSTGGLLERVVLEGADAVYRFLEEAKALEYDVVEISAGLAVLSLADIQRLIGAVNEAGLKAKPEIGLAYGIQHGDAVEVTVDRLIAACEACLEAGAWKLMIEEEGIFENVDTWQTDVIHKLVSRLPLEKLMFEASEVHVFNWLIREYGPDVNVFIDHSQVSQLACARTGVWGKKDIWGRVAVFRPAEGGR